MGKALESTAVIIVLLLVCFLLWKMSKLDFIPSFVKQFEDWDSGFSGIAGYNDDGTVSGSSQEGSGFGGGGGDAF